MKKYILLLFIFFSVNVYADTSFKEAEFVRCVDGDTAVFNVDNEEIKYRFLAVNTPELKTDAYGETASDYTCNKLSNALSIIIEEESSTSKDKYGRSLGWIWIDKSLLQQELIEKGYAKVSYIYAKYRYTESLCYLQSIAREAKIGLWENNEEEGYCSSIEYSKKNNIDFNNIDYQEDLKNNKYVKAAEKVEKASEKLDDYLSSSDEYIYIFLGFAFVVMIYKLIKR